MLMCLPLVISDGLNKLLLNFMTGDLIPCPSSFRDATVVQA